MTEPEQEVEYPNGRRQDAPDARDQSGKAQQQKAKEQAELMSLVVDLTEGFKDDTVILELDDEEVYHERGLSTNWSAGIATSATIEAPAGAATLTVSVPTRRLKQTLELDVTEPLFVVIAIAEDRLEINSHTTPPSTYF
jgi:hypothetical protein